MKFVTLQSLSGDVFSHRTPFCFYHIVIWNNGEWAEDELLSAAHCLPWHSLYLGCTCQSTQGLLETCTRRTPNPKEISP